MKRVENIELKIYVSIFLWKRPQKVVSRGRRNAFVILHTPLQKRWYVFELRRGALTNTICRVTLLHTGVQVFWVYFKPTMDHFYKTDSSFKSKFDTVAKTYDENVEIENRWILSFNIIWIGYADRYLWYELFVI